jgi:hypothetical protein
MVVGHYLGIPVTLHSVGRGSSDWLQVHGSLIVQIPWVLESLLSWKALFGLTLATGKKIRILVTALQ